MPQTSPPQRNPLFNYENGLLVLLGLSFGFAFFDRNSASVLIPYMAKDLALSYAAAIGGTRGGVTKIHDARGLLGLRSSAL